MKVEGQSLSINVVTSVFSYQNGWAGRAVYEISGEVMEGAASAGGYRAGVKVPADGDGLYLEEESSNSPMVTISRIKVINGELKNEKVTQLDWQTPEYEAFSQGCGKLQWQAIEDTEPLDAF